MTTGPHRDRCGPLNPFAQSARTRDRPGPNRASTDHTDTQQGERNSSTMRITAIQMSPGADKSQNIAQARELIQGALADGRPRLIALPEMWSCLGGDRATKFREAEELPLEGSNAVGGEAYEFLREVARGNEIHVHGGSIAELAGDRLFNTTLVFGPDGQEIARYRKIHLFDIVTPDGQGYRESAVFGAGDAVVTYEANGVKVGCAICYDLRF